MDATPPTADRPAPPKAVLFDVYGTLLDVYSVGLRAEQMFPGAGERLARAWRDKQIEYSRLVSMSGRYRPFWQLTRDALLHALLDEMKGKEKKHGRKKPHTKR